MLFRSVLVPAQSRDDYNFTAPREDAKLHAAGLKETLAALGIADPAVRDALGAALLPDVLTYDPAKPAGFLNGRRPEDDVIDAVLGLLFGPLILSIRDRHRPDERMDW